MLILDKTTSYLTSKVQKEIADLCTKIEYILDGYMPKLQPMGIFAKTKNSRVDCNTLSITECFAICPTSIPRDRMFPIR